MSHWLYSIWYNGSLVTEEKVSKEPGGIRIGKGCVDQIFAVKMAIEKDEKFFAAFMDLEKAYDRVHREALWNVLKIHGVEDSYCEELSHFIGSKCIYEGGWRAK